MSTDHPYWHRQTTDKPLFPDLLWSRPENRATAGKLTIIGGNAYGFAAPAEAYQQAVRAGIGTARVLLPDALRRSVGLVLATGDFAPSTPSGSFSQKALSSWLEQAAWADGVLLAGDIGRNSETAIVIEKFVQTYEGQLTVTTDAADYITAAPHILLARGNAVLVISFAQAQRLFTASRSTVALTYDMGLPRLVDALHDFTNQHTVICIINYLDSLCVACAGQVSTTPVNNRQERWRVPTAAASSVWWLQNPAQPFEALTTAAYELRH